MNLIPPRYRDTPAAAPQPVSDLHAAIMNLPCEPPGFVGNERSYIGAYEKGHRDARHAAAEVVACGMKVRMLTDEEITSAWRNGGQWPHSYRAIIYKFCEENGLVPSAPQPKEERKSIMNEGTNMNVIHPGRQYRHKRTGGVYLVKAHGEMKSGSNGKWEPCVVYYRAEDDATFVRDTEHFKQNFEPCGTTPD
jgi:hypothetical protein